MAATSTLTDAIAAIGKISPPAQDQRQGMVDSGPADGDSTNNELDFLHQRVNELTDTVSQLQAALASVNSLT